MRVKIVIWRIDRFVPLTMYLWHSRSMVMCGVVDVILGTRKPTLRSRIRPDVHGVFHCPFPTIPQRMDEPFIGAGI